MPLPVGEDCPPMGSRRMSNKIRLRGDSVLCRRRQQANCAKTKPPTELPTKATVGGWGWSIRVHTPKEPICFAESPFSFTSASRLFQRKTVSLRISPHGMQCSRCRQRCGLSAGGVRTKGDSFSLVENRRLFVSPTTIGRRPNSGRRCRHGVWSPRLCRRSRGCSNSRLAQPRCSRRRRRASPRFGLAIWR
jgi:hypothetical protein